MHRRRLLDGVRAKTYLLEINAKVYNEARMFPSRMSQMVDKVQTIELQKLSMIADGTVEAAGIFRKCRCNLLLDDMRLSRLNVLLVMIVTTMYFLNMQLY